MFFFQICCVALDLLCFFDVLESPFKFSRARPVEIMSLVQGRCPLPSVSPIHKCDDAVSLTPCLLSDALF